MVRVRGARAERAVPPHGRAVAGSEERGGARLAEERDRERLGEGRGRLARLGARGARALPADDGQLVGGRRRPGGGRPAAATLRAPGPPAAGGLHGGRRRRRGADPPSALDRQRRRLARRRLSRRPRRRALARPQARRPDRGGAHHGRGRLRRVRQRLLSRQRQPQPLPLHRRPQVQGQHHHRPGGPDHHRRARRHHLQPLPRGRVLHRRLRRHLGLRLQPGSRRLRQAPPPHRALPLRHRRATLRPLHRREPQGDQGHRRRQHDLPHRPALHLTFTLHTPTLLARRTPRHFHSHPLVPVPPPPSARPLPATTLLALPARDPRYASPHLSPSPQTSHFRPFPLPPLLLSWNNFRCRPFSPPPLRMGVPAFSPFPATLDAAVSAALARVP
mmetsp:Transcript_3025/g.9420  ORF Transcript_3025/g.9420 Transcript_3025/m.9420 type:complete len:389 (-) Transcript_3025:102-1268(-)